MKFCKYCKTKYCCDRGGFCYVDPYVLKRLLKNKDFKALLLNKDVIDEHGRPKKVFFTNKGCLIYEHRPPSCRVYFCEHWKHMKLKDIARLFSKKMSVKEFINYLKDEFSLGTNHAHAGGYLCFSKNTTNLTLSLKNNFNCEIGTFKKKFTKEIRVIVDILDIHKILKIPEITKPHIYGKDFTYIIITQQRLEKIFQNMFTEDLLAMKIFEIV